MSTPPPTAGRERSAPRSFATLGAFGIGVPLALGFLALVRLGPWHDTPLERYVRHPVEVAEVLLFGCAMAGLAVKLAAALRERVACRAEVLPPWAGRPVSVGDAPGLRAQLPEPASSCLVRRVDAVLDFVSRRGTAAGLDDQLRALADTDAMTQENSYSLIRFITWAIPILGFLGTVLGITEAIAGVTPEILEKSLSTVTDGLAVAFDTTAVALALTMVTMFCSFLTERLEQTVLETVDHFVDVQLAHRFERHNIDQGPFVAALEQNTAVLLKATEQLVQGQASVWADTMRQQQGVLMSALEAALEKTLTTHQARLTETEEHMQSHGAAVLDQLTRLTGSIRDVGRDQQASLAQVLNAVTAQTTALAQLQEEGQQLVRLQDALQQNLAALQGAGSFEQAVQSLTAAIHLLTARAAPAATRTRPGAAA
jgi:hypothetical protein